MQQVKRTQNCVDVLDRMRGGLIVSCQALESEPLYGGDIMAYMALAARVGGAVGIRANGVRDIEAIAQKVSIPIIGLIKQVYPKSRVFITPTSQEVAALVASPASLIAIDATDNERPAESVGVLIDQIHRGGKKAVADIATLAQAKMAVALGADAVSTTLCGYEQQPVERILDMNKLNEQKPDVTLIRCLSEILSVPVIAEGHISTPEQARECIEAGAHCVVVGAAITRPQLITAKFVKALTK